MSDYRSKFLKDPFTVTFDMATIKNGLYLIEGSFGEDGWKEICKRMDSDASKGEGKSSLSLDKKNANVHIYGTIELEIERVCTRSLDSFLEKSTIEVDEHLTLNPEIAEEGSDILLQGDFNIGSFVADHIVIGINPYPIHPNSEDTERGAVIVSDGMDEEVEEEKNPFSALKDLQS